ncbi:MAG: hypothetical protein L0229_15600 [Blastocatellia bacterium]|nr:hypothetical protein [Blastocatellia bacterium]
MKGWHRAAACCALLAWCASAQAVLKIKITQGVASALPIAITPFDPPGARRPGVDIAAIVAADLESSGGFVSMPRADMPSRPHGFSEINFADWRRVGMDNLVVGTVRPGIETDYQVEFWLADVYKGAQLLAYKVPANAAQLRLVAHQISDVIYEKLAGVKGAFATRIAYVTVQKRGGRNKTYGLQVADIDGENVQTLLTSPQPLMSPAWSPDGRRLAYVSFEGRSSAIYVQDLGSGHRDKVAAETGINSAPAWSPDGSRLALTLSRDGDPEIYVLTLASRHMRRINENKTKSILRHRSIIRHSGDSFWVKPVILLFANLRHRLLRSHRRPFHPRSALPSTTSRAVARKGERE